MESGRHLNKQVCLRLNLECSNFGINDLKMKRHKYESTSRIISVQQEGIGYYYYVLYFEFFKINSILGLHTLHYEHCHTPLTCLLLDVAHYRSSVDIRTFAVAQEALQTRENSRSDQRWRRWFTPLCPRICLEIPLYP